MAYIGDSRAVLGSRDSAGGGMVAVQLTVDLKPDVPSTPPHSHTFKLAVLVSFGSGPNFLTELN